MIPKLRAVSKVIKKRRRQFRIPLIHFRVNRQRAAPISCKLFFIIYHLLRSIKSKTQNIGFIFQFHHLLPEFTSLENVMIPALIGKGNRKEIEKKSKELLSFLGLEDRLTHKPAELSGGEKQRVAVARALINQPAVIFADEPSGSLDSQNKEELHQLFFDLRKQLNQTFVIVTHDENLAKMTDRVIRIRDGMVIKDKR